MTKSTVKFYEVFDDKIDPLVNVCQQQDGYLEGVGRELCLWLQEHCLINGIGLYDVKNSANGAGCLAAQFVRDFKYHAGGLYIYPFDECAEYNYEVYVPYVTKRVNCADIVTIKVSSYDYEPFFEGTVNELLEEIVRLDGY